MTTISALDEWIAKQRGQARFIESVFCRERTTIKPPVQKTWVEESYPNARKHEEDFEMAVYEYVHGIIDYKGLIARM